MTDLPPAAVHIAAGLVGAVHDRDADMVARWLAEAGPRHHACDMRELHAVVVALAAMVDDTKSTLELLAWVDRTDVMAWRANLTDGECRELHTLYMRGDRDPVTCDGEREYGKRKAARLRSAA